ncbi:MAG: AI-2E family transporter, partial [Gemmatimonadaceae bacterium]|nr:AI-2E family transporter [Acetobacteraceae bacterium]
MNFTKDRVPERLMMGLLLVGIAVGCAIVLLPFLSAILWAAILVFSTWPMFVWIRVRLGASRGWAAGIMVMVTAVLIVLPLGLAAPSGADEVNQLRAAIEGALSGGLPNAPQWLISLPFVGTTAAE